MNDHMQIQVEYEKTPAWVRMWLLQQPWYDELVKKIEERHPGELNWQTYHWRVFQIAQEMGVTALRFSNQTLIVQIPVTPEVTALMLKYATSELI